MKAEILENIKKYDRIIIHRHVRPDPDALGSQGGLAQIIKDSFPDKEVYMAGEEIDSLTFLVKMDEITDEMYEGALVIVCDTANSPRISDQRYRLGDKVIKIDHHPNEDPYGDLLWVDTNASSVSEMIMDFGLSGREQGLVLTKETARLLYAGIVGDTGRFLYSNTTERTFRYAAELIAAGVSTHEIYEGLYKTSEPLARLTGYVMEHFKTYDSGRVGSMHLTKDILVKYGVTVSEASLLVNAFSHVEGMLAWAFFVDEPDQVRVRIRSKGPVVNVLARQFNGGGHPRSSGATVYTAEDTQKVIEGLRRIVSDYTF
ncbi:bifunctional oligoribonuclease/PAP phosphatase NrnA [Fictibacillus aquaticus]|uniref:DHH family phosphoesterase n=1 Tax=Fictibacillus aquaticus TaxID=2021314 RepID=A0A235FAG8_9BACL|nr:bifunctional oligoribonuclease/PAP phosphatase NrnA [Fictibacillus aquaticus]OYD58189.1 DHH family phosphoesterase [Fictibacillus aquaticus]